MRPGLLWVIHWGPMEIYQFLHKPENSSKCFKMTRCGCINARGKWGNAHKCRDKGRVNLYNNHSVWVAEPYHAVRCILTSFFMIVIMTRSIKRDLCSLWLPVDSQQIFSVPLSSINFMTYFCCVYMVIWLTHSRDIYQQTFVNVYIYQVTNRHYHWHAHACLVTQLYPTLCNPID